MHYRPEGCRVPGAGALVLRGHVLRVADGRVLDEISVLEALNYPGLLSINYPHSGLGSRTSPTSTRRSPCLRPAPAFPLFAPGDLLVSLRNINTVA